MATSVNPPAAGATRSSRWLVAVCVSAVVAIFILRLAAIVEPMGPDQGVYATIGWTMHRGFALYRDLFEMKPPGLYVIYWLAFGLAGPRASTIFWIDYAAAAVTTM